jgi:hypothetical protein
MARERIRVAVISDEICLRDPVTKKRLTTEGKVVLKDAFWSRRLACGDCIELPVNLEKAILPKGGDEE